MMLPSAAVFRHSQGIAAAAVGTVAVAGLTAYLLLRQRLTPEQKEERRRRRLAAIGRVIDGTLIDTAPEDLAPKDLAENSAPENSAPQALIYRYRVSGVTYECGQDVSALAALLPDLGEAAAVFGMPVQVRYDRDNPADSIVISETWNGLWEQHATSSHAED